MNVATEVAEKLVDVMADSVLRRRLERSSIFCKQKILERTREKQNTIGYHIHQLFSISECWEGYRILVFESCLGR
jgi:hypothetical protein